MSDKNVISREDALSFIEKYSKVNRDDYRKDYTKEFWKVVNQFANDPVIVTKLIDLLGKKSNIYQLPCINDKYFFGAAAEKIVSLNPDNQNIAETMFNLAIQKNDRYVKGEINRYGYMCDNPWDELNCTTGNSLGIYYSIVRCNPHNLDIACKILENLISRKGDFNNCNKSGYDIQYDHIGAGDIPSELLSSMIKNDYKDNKFNQLAMKYIQANMKKFSSELISWDMSDEKCRNSCSKDKDLYIPDTPSHDPRRHIVELAEHNTEFPELVEQCLKITENFPNYHQDNIYNGLLAAGYKANNFEDRYAQRLNNREFDFQNFIIDAYNLGIPFTAVAGIADKLDTKVLCEVTEQARRIIDYQEAEAKRWRHEPDLSDTDYENVKCLKAVTDKRIREEAIAEAKAQENSPAVIFIEEFVGERYGDWAERVYIRDNKGEYIATDIVDDNDYDNEDSSARDQLGNLVTAQGIIYNWDKETSDYQVLEAKEDCQYRVLSDTAYWRDKQTSALYHRGANKESVLVSKNPITRKFEDVPYDNIERDHGDFVEGAKKSDDGSRKKVIYKRNDKDGKFYPEVEFPYGECISCFHNSKDEISMVFLTGNGETFKYEAKGGASTLKKQDEGKDDWQVIYYSDPMLLKAEMLREKLGDKVGKTGDVKTGEVTAEHRATAKEQAEIIKALMQARRAKQGK